MSDVTKEEEEEEEEEEKEENEEEKEPRKDSYNSRDNLHLVGLNKKDDIFYCYSDRNVTICVPS